MIAGIVVGLVVAAGVAALLLRQDDQKAPGVSLADCAKLGEDEIRACYANSSTG